MADQSPEPDILRAVRIGDRERNRYADHLAQMTGEGFISQDEHSARIGKIATAQTAADLKAIVADLPAPPLQRADARELARRAKLDRKTARVGWAKFRAGVLGLIGTAFVSTLLLIPVPVSIWARPPHVPVDPVRIFLLNISIISGIGLWAVIAAWWVWLYNAKERKHRAGHGRP